MRKQDRLLTIIKSLTPAEKKYFVQQATADGQFKSYLKLYEALLTADAYNATELSRQLGKKKTDLANEKHYLEQVLMRSLRMCNDREPDIALLHQTAELNVLMHKHLYGFALERVVDIKQLAVKNNNYGLLSALVSVELTATIYNSKEYMDVEARVKGLLTEGRKAIANVGIYFDLTELSYQIEQTTHLKTAPGTNTYNERVAQLLGHPLLDKEQEVPLFETIRLGMLYTLYHGIGDFEKAIPIAQKTIALYYTDAKAINGNERMFYLWTAGLLLLYVYTQQYSKVHGYLDELEQKSYHQVALSAQKMDEFIQPEVIKLRLYLLGEEYMAGMGDAGRMKQELKRFEAQKTKLQPLMIPMVWINTLINAAKLYLLVGDPASAINTLNEVVHKTDINLNVPWQAGGRLLLLMAHQEAGNYAILASLAGSTKRFYTSNKLLTKVEEVTLKHIIRLPKMRTVNERKAAFEALKAEYELLAADKAMLAMLKKCNLLPWVDRNLKRMR